MPSRITRGLIPTGGFVINGRPKESPQIPDRLDSGAGQQLSRRFHLVSNLRRKIWMEARVQQSLASSSFEVAMNFCFLHPFCFICSRFRPWDSGMIGGGGACPGIVS